MGMYSKREIKGSEVEMKSKNNNNNGSDMWQKG